MASMNCFARDESIDWSVTAERVIKQEYLVSVNSKEAERFNHDSRVRAASAKMNCSVELTQRFVRKFLNPYMEKKHYVVCISGADYLAIDKCNKLIEAIFPFYSKRKKYTKRKFGNTQIKNETEISPVITALPMHEKIQIKRKPFATSKNEHNSIPKNGSLPCISTAENTCKTAYRHPPKKSRNIPALIDGKFEFGNSDSDHLLHLVRPTPWKTSNDYEVARTDISHDKERGTELISDDMSTDISDGMQFLKVLDNSLLRSQSLTKENAKATKLPPTFSEIPLQYLSTKSHRTQSRQNLLKLPNTNANNSLTFERNRRMFHSIMINTQSAWRGLARIRLTHQSTNSNNFQRHSSNQLQANEMTDLDKHILEFEKRRKLDRSRHRKTQSEYLVPSHDLSQQRCQRYFVTNKRGNQNHPSHSLYPKRNSVPHLVSRRVAVPQYPPLSTFPTPEPSPHVEVSQQSQRSLWLQAEAQPTVPTFPSQLQPQIQPMPNQNNYIAQQSFQNNIPIPPNNTMSFLQKNESNSKYNEESYRRHNHSRRKHHRSKRYITESHNVDKHARKKQSSHRHHQSKDYRSDRRSRRAHEEEMLRSQQTFSEVSFKTPPHYPHRSKDYRKDRRASRFHGEDESRSQQTFSEVMFKTPPSYHYQSNDYRKDRRPRRIYAKDDLRSQQSFSEVSFKTPPAHHYRKGSRSRRAHEEDMLRSQHTVSEVSFKTPPAHHYLSKDYRKDRRPRRLHGEDESKSQQTFSEVTFKTPPAHHFQSTDYRKDRRPRRLHDGDESKSPQTFSEATFKTPSPNKVQENVNKRLLKKGANVIELQLETGNVDNHNKPDEQKVKINSSKPPSGKRRPRPDNAKVVICNATAMKLLTEKAVPEKTKSKTVEVIEKAPKKTSSHNKSYLRMYLQRSKKLESQHTLNDIVKDMLTIKQSIPNGERRPSKTNNKHKEKRRISSQRSEGMKDGTASGEEVKDKTNDDLKSKTSSSLHSSILDHESPQFLKECELAGYPRIEKENKSIDETKHNTDGETSKSAGPSDEKAQKQTNLSGSISQPSEKEAKNKKQVHQTQPRAEIQSEKSSTTYFDSLNESLRKAKIKKANAKGNVCTSHEVEEKSIHSEETKKEKQVKKASNDKSDYILNFFKKTSPHKIVKSANMCRNSTLIEDSKRVAEEHRVKKMGDINENCSSPKSADLSKSETQVKKTDSMDEKDPCFESPNPPAKESKVKQTDTTVDIDFPFKLSNPTGKEINGNQIDTMGDIGFTFKHPNPSGNETEENKIETVDDVESPFKLPNPPGKGKNTKKMGDNASSLKTPNLQVTGKQVQKQLSSSTVDRPPPTKLVNKKKTNSSANKKERKNSQRSRKSVEKALNENASGIHFFTHKYAAKNSSARQIKSKLKSKLQSSLDMFKPPKNHDLIRFIQERTKRQNERINLVDKRFDSSNASNAYNENDGEEQLGSNFVAKTIKCLDGYTPECSLYTPRTLNPEICLNPVGESLKSDACCDNSYNIPVDKRVKNLQKYLTELMTFEGRSDA